MSLKSWIITLLVLGLAAAGGLYFMVGQERFINLIFKYGPKMAISAGVLLILILLVRFIISYRRKQRKKREEESRLDLRDLFSND